MSNQHPDEDTYALATGKVITVNAPKVHYQPPVPRQYSPRIGLVGAGGIASAHLDAYRTAGFDVVAICNRTLSKACSRRDEFFPQAFATDNYQDLLNDDSIEVLDITPHPADRLPLMEQALSSGKHVLSQKPFVLDLSEGDKLIRLADEKNVKLAVNQNGRWAPHLAYLREAVLEGLIGDLISCHISIHWDHSWISGTAFEEIPDLVFQDFGIHWFDFLASITGDRIQSVFATTTQAVGQRVQPPLLSQALVRLDSGQASLVFDAATPFGPQDSIYIAGTKGTLMSSGPDLGQQTVTLVTKSGHATPELKGTWFNDGFRGAMGELLCAIEDNRQPSNNARDNLVSLALAFAVIESANSGKEVGFKDRRGLSFKL